MKVLWYENVQADQRLIRINFNDEVLHFDIRGQVRVALSELEHAYYSVIIV